jgi:hypothetical protein
MSLERSGITAEKGLTRLCGLPDLLLSGWHEQTRAGGYLSSQTSSMRAPLAMLLTIIVRPFT